MRNEFNYSLRILVAEIKRQGKKDLSSIGRFTLTEEGKSVAILLYKLVMQTDYFRQDTKRYLISRNGSLRNFKKDNKCAANKNTSISRIRYDQKKIKMLLEIDNLESLFDNSIADLEEYKQKLMKMIKKYEYQKLLSDYWIKPSINIEEMESVEILSESELEDFETLKKYGTKEGKKLLESLMSERIVGHIKYLQERTY